MKRLLLFSIVLLSNYCPLFSQVEEAKLLSIWTDSTLIGSNAHGNIYNEIWGYAINGHEYAIIGSTRGTHFIDVTDPANPFEVHFVLGRSSGGHIVHRDYHDYKGFLYVVADEGSNSLQIIDMNQLPESLTVVEHDAFSRAHNIFIDTVHARLYRLSGKVDIYDLSNPINPILVNSYFPAGGVHDGYIDGHIGFINIGGDGLEVVDFSNPNDPIKINSLTEYPNRGYNHSGWVSDDCGTYYFADETHGSPLKAMDISNLCDLEVGKTFDAAVENSNSIAHNLIAACNYLYVSYYYEGLRVYDISDPLNPELVRFYDTYPSANGRAYKGAWGVYPFLPSGNILVSDMQFGLHIFESMGDNCNNDFERNNGCLQNQICSLTPTNDFSIFNDFKITPNPTIDQTSLIVNLSSALDNLTISLSNINGQNIQNWQHQNVDAGENVFPILLPNSLSEGVYFISLRSKQFYSTKKLVIER